MQRFNKNLQANEVATMHYLGIPYVVLQRHPCLSLMVPLSTRDFALPGAEESAMALQVRFNCSANYPLQLPSVELTGMRNVSSRLELRMREEIALTLAEHFGLHMIVAVVTRLQMLLNKKERP
ncbi:CG15605 [Drosophila busckii]|uniref:CG15605 n=2 Tax=Drosophila busckii TaxID=30019 RepID=A0A0M5IX90_DROBS|nr:CG15605 [Drosophila busckii]